MSSRCPATKVRRGEDDAGVAQQLDHACRRRTSRVASRHRSGLLDAGDGPTRPNGPRRRSEAAIAEVKKYFSSKMPREVAMYLLEVTRRRRSIHASPMASATAFRLSGRRCCDAVGQEAVLLADDLGGDLEDGLARRWSRLVTSQLAVWHPLGEEAPWSPSFFGRLPPRHYGIDRSG